MRPSKDTISRNMKAFFTLFLAGALIGPFFYCTQNELPESVQGQRSAFKIDGGGTFSKTGSSQYSPILLKMTGGTHAGKLVLLYGTNENLNSQCDGGTAVHNIMVAVSTDEYDNDYRIGNLPMFNAAKPLKINTGTATASYSCLNSSTKIQFTAAWSNILTSPGPSPIFEKGIKYYQFDDSKLKTATILASTLPSGPQTGAALTALSNEYTQGTIPLGANSFKFGTTNSGPIDYILTYKEATINGETFYELYFFNHDQAASANLEEVKVFGVAFSEKPTGAALLSTQYDEGNKKITTRWLINDQTITITSTIATSSTTIGGISYRANDVINPPPTNPTTNPPAMAEDLLKTLASRGLWLTGMSALANETPARSFMVFSAGKLETPPVGPPTIISNTENIYAVTTHSLQQMWNLKKQEAGGPGGGPPTGGPKAGP